MTAARRLPASTDALELLERAVSYTLGSVAAVTTELLSVPTPCTAWNLRGLLDHLIDSLDALCEGLDAEHICADPVAAPATDPVAAFRANAARLVGACSAAGRGGSVVTVLDRSLTTRTVAIAGAIEVAVHGWDVARACGPARPIPGALAGELLRCGPLVVTACARDELFAPAVTVSDGDSPSDRLVGYLGRDPRR